MSETAEVVGAIFGFIPSDLFVLIFGGWEIAIGVTLLSRRTAPLAVGLMLVHLTAIVYRPHQRGRQETDDVIIYDDTT